MAKIAVALSGGVDSTVAALLLREAGHELVAMSLSLGSGPDEAAEAGARSAGQLGIPHVVVPAAREFARLVLDPVAESYAAGRTPNPCALCNAGVKLPLLWEAARGAGCQALATGHYARLVEQDGRRRLAEGADPQKSQAYFLARLEPALLDRLVLPLGEWTKERVRDKARAHGLAAVERPESQDACFLPPGGWDQFMAERGLVRPGPVLDRQGRRLAEHSGLHRFTVGQRRGLGVALGKPAYVLRLDGDKAAVIVGAKRFLRTYGLVGIAPLWYDHWLEAKKIRFRYSHRGVGCRVEPEDQGVRAEFEEAQGAVAPGQLAVFYTGPLVVGSAWIQKSLCMNAT